MNKKFVMAGGFLLALAVCGTALVFSKAINLNQYFVSGYALHGVDVSHYQGEVDWKALEDQGIDFAFIKATEGSSHLDGKFSENWTAAENTGLYTGAYHFFSFDSAGQTQADWYIQTVGNLDGRLAPAVDVEYYGDKEINPPEKKLVIRELQEFLDTVEGEYHVKPIIYTTYKVYRRYIADEFEEYPLWIRNVYYSPNLDMKEEWQFWQYTDRAVLAGYAGTEKYIDLNVFDGNEDGLKEYLVKPGTAQ